MRKFKNKLIFDSLVRGEAYMGLFKRKQLIYANDMSFHEKKLVCKRLNHIYYACYFTYIDIDVARALSHSISSGEILNEKEINQVNRILNLKVRLNLWWRNNS